MPWLTSPPGIFRVGYSPEDNTTVTLYATDPGLFPGYQPARPLGKTKGGTRAGVSLIAVAKDERESVPGWIECILNGSRTPDEIIVVDTGSTDGTIELLKSLAARSRVPFHVLERKGINIAQGRNAAISATQYPVIAVTDLGSYPRADWLERLVFPFDDDPEIQVSAGVYQAIDSKGQPVIRRHWLDLAQLTPQDYLPASISIAFKKDAWEAVGGYPEWLSLTGEDTYFALELKRVTSQWAFVPEAVVEWLAPVTHAAYWRKLHNWSVGNGEAGLNGGYYWRAALQLGLAGFVLLLVLVLIWAGIVLGSMVPVTTGIMIGLASCLAVLIWARKSRYRMEELVRESGAKIAQLLGFFKGRRNRRGVDLRRQESVEGLFFVLSGVPIDDTGGGARGSQIARELLRRRFMVVFLNKFPSYESTDLRLEIRHPNLVTASLQKFSLDRFKRENAPDLFRKPCGVLVEIPDGDFMPVVQGLRADGATVIYDLIDDWNSTLGGKWYSKEIEGQLVQSAHALSATAPLLAHRLEESYHRPAVLLPNAVNLRLFNPERAFPRPADLPVAERIILYAGSLWGEWFDWELLVEIASSYPAAGVVVIGDYRGQCPKALPNLHFLGLKPQATLPAYLAHADVAIIPWKSSPITETTSPLKLYEYLAMRKPIVAPDLPLLAGIPYVLLSKGREDFIRNIEIASELRVGGEAWKEFLRENSWQSRVDQLIEIMRASRNPV